jgi:GNAT superfamily N-acetyltransferase
LIGAVLLDEQNGEVYADHPAAPRQVYVEHGFGFAHIFGDTNPELEVALRKFLLLDKQFTATKVRLYTTDVPLFLRGPECDLLRSERQRFVLDPASPRYLESCRQISTSKIATTAVTPGNVGEIEDHFGVVGRFWRSPEEFVVKSFGHVAWIDGKPAAICYAAAVFSGHAEVDVLTLPEYRRMGLGKYVVTLFSRNCLDHGLQPVWDCFTNNSGSMALSQSAGFVSHGLPYEFFTLTR